MSNESNESFKSSSDKDSDDEHLVIKYKNPLKRKKGEEEDMSEYVIGEKFEKACLATKKLKEIRRQSQHCLKFTKNGRIGNCPL